MFAPTVTMDKIGPLSRLPGSKSLGDSGFLHSFRVVSSDDMANPEIHTIFLKISNQQKTHRIFFKSFNWLFTLKTKMGKCRSQLTALKKTLPKISNKHIPFDLTNSGRSWCCSHQKLGCIKPKEFECTEAGRGNWDGLKTWNLCWLKLDCWGPSSDFGGWFFCFVLCFGS